MLLRFQSGRVLVLSSLLVIVLMAMGWQTDVSGSDHSIDPVSAKAGLGVADSIAVNGEANIVIALQSPTGVRDQPASLDGLRQGIAVMQDAVLSGLEPGDFQLHLRFQSVPALTGRVFTNAGLARLAANPHVARIDLDVGGTGGLANSVPVIGADLRHETGNRGEGVVVAVIDSGLDTDHEDLADDLIHQECFLDNNGVIDGSGLCPNGSDRQSGSGAAEDDAGHGTHVTGIVTSRGVLSAIGVAPDADFVAIKVTAGPSFAGVFYSFMEIVAALDFIINNPEFGIKVINISLVTGARFAGDCDDSTAWNMAGAAAVGTLRENGVITFASSGNNGSGTQMASPACLSQVVSVGATDNLDNVASFTNSNASTDIMAPGVGILSDGLNNSTTSASGTSMASPHAAGCAALLIESAEATTPDQIETRLKTSPITVTDPTNGINFPRISCFTGELPASMSLAKKSGTSMVTQLGQVVPYLYVLSNTGRVTLHDVFLTDDNVDEPPVCEFPAGDLLTVPPDPASSVICRAQHTVTQEELEAATLDNTATAWSDETEPVSASLTIPVGLFADGFESDICSCWSLQDLSSLPLAGTEPECVALESRFDLFQVGGCEHSYGVSFTTSGSECFANRFDCPDLPDLSAGIKIDEEQFFVCLDQLNTRCEELGIEPPVFP